MNAIVQKSAETQTSQQEQKLERQLWIVDQLVILAEVFGSSLSNQALQVYAAQLCDLSTAAFKMAMTRAMRELKFFPRIAELRQLAGASPEMAASDRPGPEEAWARMPKGERTEEDSVVWCEEERAAYGACRPLILTGDLIGARMAFKERYEKEVEIAVANGRTVAWSASIGFDRDQVVTVLSEAVRLGRITADAAQALLPYEKRDEFNALLSGGDGKGLLTGAVERRSVFAELCERMGYKPKMMPPKIEPLTPEQIRQRKEEVRAQAKLLEAKRQSGAITTG